MAMATQMGYPFGREGTAVTYVERKRRRAGVNDAPGLLNER
jgi:GTP1/Obg family GTP-binding protein